MNENTKLHYCERVAHGIIEKTTYFCEEDERGQLWYGRDGKRQRRVDSCVWCGYTSMSQEES